MSGRHHSRSSRLLTSLRCPIDGTTDASLRCVNRPMAWTATISPAVPSTRPAAHVRAHLESSEPSTPTTMRSGTLISAVFAPETSGTSPPTNRKDSSAYAPPHLSPVFRSAGSEPAHLASAGHYRTPGARQCRRSDRPHADRRLHPGGTSPGRSLRFFGKIEPLQRTTGSGVADWFGHFGLVPLEALGDALHQHLERSCLSSPREGVIGLHGLVETESGGW